MERLTYFKKGRWWVNVDGVRTEGDPIDRLAAYEDSGLEPDEIKYIKLMAMGRADTENSAFGGLSIDRLKALAEADKDGRVMVLPCKVGDTVWCVTRVGIKELAITSLEKNRYGYYAVAYGVAFRIEDFGKDVFLTREEAEAKLKEVQKDG